MATTALRLVALAAVAGGAFGACNGGAAGPSAVTAAPTASAVTINLAAKGTMFTAATLEAPADEPFAIAFDNQDAAVTHDVAILNSTGGLIFNGQDIMGPAKVTDNVPPLQAGTYKFICTFHPVPMTGQLTVK